MPATLSEALREVKLMSVAGDGPDHVGFFCKDGSIRIATMKQGFDACEGCDCGWAFFEKAAYNLLMLPPWEYVSRLQPRFTKPAYEALPTTALYDFYRAEEDGFQLVRRRFLLDEQGTPGIYTWRWEEP